MPVAVQNFLHHYEKDSTKLLERVVTDDELGFITGNLKRRPAVQFGNCRTNRRRENSK